MGHQPAHLLAPRRLRSHLRLSQHKPSQIRFRSLALTEVYFGLARKDIHAPSSKNFNDDGLVFHNGFSCQRVN